MALLTQSNVYKDPRANVLYGAGSGKYTPQQIRDYIKTPGRTDDDVLGKALAEGVTADEISSAMAGDSGYAPDKVSKYLAGKGISRDLAPTASVPKAEAPPAVVPGNVTVGNKETVAGQMHGILQDPNNPLNVQAQTYGEAFANRRGLLNSSIAATAAQDALYKNALPIASQDASTNYDANKTNVGNKLTAGMFNNDLTSRLGMFNAGTEKDIAINDKNQAVNQAINTQNRSMDFAIANMDAGNKLAIAQVQAAANDSGIMGDLGKSFMSLYQQTASDPNISPEVKAQIYNTLKSQFEQVSGLLPSFENIGKKISFGSASGSGGTSFENTPAGGGLLTGGTGSGSSGGLGESPKLKSSIEKVNVLGYKPEPQVMAGVAAYERATGSKVDRSLVVPEQLIEDFKYQSQNGFTTSYLSSDGTVKKRNFEAYDFPALLKAAGVEGVGNLQKLFIPVHPPGSMRADNPMFYVWNTDVLEKLK